MPHAMRAIRSFLVCLLLLWSGFAGLAHGQETKEEFHTFTLKEDAGKKLEARVLSISADRKQVQILPRSGVAAPVEILRLSLEDQLYLKTWLSSAQAATAKPSNLRLTVTSAANTTSRERDNYYEVQNRTLKHTIKLQNLDRAETGPLKVELLVLARNGVDVARTEDNKEFSIETWPTGRRLRFEKFVLEIPSLAYNREHTVTTEGLVLEEVRYAGSTVYGEDEATGYLLRVTTAEGKTVLEKNELDAAAPEKLRTWEPALVVIGPSTKGVLDMDSTGDLTLERE